MATSLKAKKNSAFVIIAIFSIALAFFVIASKQVSFHDTHEYITAVKELSGNGNIAVYSTHPLLYPYIVSLFAKVWPSLITIKLLNITWLILTAALLWNFSKNKKLLVLWAFSPLVWWLSPQFTPVLPATFFITLSFLCFKQWEETKKKKPFMISAISAGLSIAIYTPAVIVLSFFVLAFFYDKKFLYLLYYIALAIIGFIPILILDYILFGIPFYSIIRYLGVNVTYLLGYHVSSFHDMFLVFQRPIMVIVSFIMISPVIFMLYKIDFKKSKRIVFFLIPPALFFLIRALGGKYFMLFTPITLILLADVLSKKEVRINSILSIFIIIGLTTISSNIIPDVTYSLFSKNNQDVLLEGDFNQIKEDYKNDAFISNEALALSSVSWKKDDPYLIWLEEYSLERKGESSFRKLTLASRPAFNSYQQLDITFELKRGMQKNIPKNTPLLLTKGMASPFEDYRQSKCYQVICVFEPQK